MLNSALTMRSVPIQFFMVHLKSVAEIGLVRMLQLVHRDKIREIHDMTPPDLALRLETRTSFASTQRFRSLVTAMSHESVTVFS